jgi:hypothetical protein
LQHSRRTVLSFFLTAIFVVAACAMGDAACPSSKAPAPPPSPSASPGPVAFTTAMPGATAAPSPSPSPYVQPQLYDVADEIETINRDGTLYYYFQGNRDGTAKVKKEIRYGRNLWNDCAQVRIRIPFITKYPLVGNPYSGLGNIEPGYGYFVTSKTFDHSIEFRVAFPTNANNVDNKDTELKGFYNLKWKWPGWALSYTNEYDQSIIKPPAGTWTSYYEGKLTLPDYRFAKGVKVSAFWNYRVLFDTGGIFKDALGATIFGSINVVALSITDSWGLGYNGLWKFKFEANATAKF